MFVKNTTMAAIAGITTKKNAKGQLKHVTVDIRKHAAVIPMFNEMGLLPETKFQQEWKTRLSIEEVRIILHKQIDELWSK